MQIFNFVVLSVITVPYNVPTSHINKTHLSIASLNVCELELKWCSKDQLRKKEAPYLHKGTHIQNEVQSK